MISSNKACATPPRARPRDRFVMDRSKGKGQKIAGDLPSLSLYIMARAAPHLRVLYQRVLTMLSSASRLSRSLRTRLLPKLEATCCCTCSAFSSDLTH
jgi:hypothetical protein